MYYQQPNPNPYMYYNPYLQPQVPVNMPVNTPVNTAPASVPNVVNSSSVPQIKLDTVSGKTAADVYNVKVGEEAVLIDIDNPCIYKKTRGMDNKLTCEVYDLVPHIEESAPVAPKINLDEYVKQDAIDDIVSERVKEEVDKRLSEISFTPKTRKTKVVEE